MAKGIRTIKQKAEKRALILARPRLNWYKNANTENKKLETIVIIKDLILNIGSGLIDINLIPLELRKKLVQYLNIQDKI